MTGILVEEVDHVVVGARLSDASIIVGLKTRRRYVPERVVKKLQAVPHPEAHDERIYRFRGAITPLHAEGLLNCLDDETLILAWAPDVKAVRPSTGGKPREELATLLEKRVKEGGPLWLAGSLSEKQVQSLDLLQKVGVLGSLGEDDLKPWKGVRAGALWLTLEGKVTVQAVARAADVGKREALEAWLKGKLGDKKDVKLVPDGEWLALQYRPGE
jgi:hypothetical protein